MTTMPLDISVIICTYTEARWHNLVTAVTSMHQQIVPPREIIVVVDHNPPLLERVRTHLPDVIGLENLQSRGLSGARNCGIAVAQGQIIAFMDEDAIATSDWLMQLRARYEHPLVMGVGGPVEPMWLEGWPAWFPEEFNWVVGCTYRGLPEKTARVRNLIGCNMSFRRQVFETNEAFRNGLGRVGTRPVGCEETEFCIRVSRQGMPNLLLFEPQARVRHCVPANRACWGYFCARCYAEGRSKAQVASLVGSGQGLATERSYTLRTLPQGIIRGLADTFFRHDVMGLARAGAIVAGLALTTAGYVMGTVSEWLPRPRRTVLTQISHSLSKKGAGPATPEIPDFKPVQLLEVEISRPLPAVPAFDPVTGRGYQRALALVRLHRQPLGVIELNLDENGLTASEYARQIWDELGPEIKEHMRQDEWPEISELEAGGLSGLGSPKCVRDRARFLSQAPLVSIVVATHNRPDSLSNCLKALSSLDYPNYEIIVVDNAPGTSATAELVHHSQSYNPAVPLHYVREDRPGLAVAHNRGLMDVKGSIVAFTDDDVLVDKDWLTALVRAFDAAENVACVTGIIIPAELETPAQLWIEQFGGFSKGYSRRVFDLSGHRPQGRLYPYTAGIFGSGANMAFRTSILRELGGFDPALGAGTLAMGGDDLAAFFQVITRGYQLVYEPGAILKHWHRRDYAGLKRQMHGYGVGLMAYLTGSLLDRPGLLLDFALRIPAGLVHLLSPHSPKNSKKSLDYPTELTRLEWQGMLYGPLAYLRSRRQASQPHHPHSQKGTTIVGSASRLDTKEVF